MARQRHLPFHKVRSRVKPRTGTHMPARLLVGVGAVIAIVVTSRNAVFRRVQLGIRDAVHRYLGVTGAAAPCTASACRARQASEATAKAIGRARPEVVSSASGAYRHRHRRRLHVLAIINLECARWSTT